MLAGVGGIDLVLLVIAADESIKPQTREHFDILQLLGVNRGITVLTKSDAVDPDTLDVVRLEVEEFLRGTFLEPPKSPIVAVSSLTGAGLEDLKAAIVEQSSKAQARDSLAIARLPNRPRVHHEGLRHCRDGNVDIRRHSQRRRAAGFSVHAKGARPRHSGSRPIRETRPLPDSAPP